MWRKQNASEQWISHTAFLQSFAKPKREHANLRSKRIIFGTVALVRKNGSSALKVSSGRLSFKRSDTSGQIVRSVFKAGAAQMFARVTAAFVFLATGPALAQEMNAEEAQRFASGKLFAFNCIGGLRGAGRIYADGSVIGNIQWNDGGPVQPVWLPAGTLRIQGKAVCASLQGLSFKPCFTVTRTSDQSFRTSISGVAIIAYCDFTEQTSVAGSPTN